MDASYFFQNYWLLPQYSISICSLVRCSCISTISKRIILKKIPKDMESELVEQSTQKEEAVEVAVECKSSVENEKNQVEETGNSEEERIDSDINSDDDNKIRISKNQQRKRRRYEKKMEIKKRRKQQDKEIKEAKAKAAGRNIDEERRISESRRQLMLNNEFQSKNRTTTRIENHLTIAKTDSFQVCIDCSFESYMTPKEINSLALQVRYCYAVNKRSDENMCILTATSLTGQTLDHLKKVDGFNNWTSRGFTCTADPIDVYFKDNIKNVVYLTSDSENTLNLLEKGKVYVIGGIVDRNRLKRAAYNRATEQLNVATAKLPIDEYLAKMESTRVLTCNHVFEIILQYKSNGGNWEKALLDVLPSRKDAKSKIDLNPSV